MISSLSKCVVEIGGVTGAALGFDDRRFFRLVAFLLKKLDGLIEVHVAGVHLDADDEARVAQQSVLQLAEAQEFGLALVFRAGAGLTVAVRRASSARCSVPSPRRWWWS